MMWMSGKIRACYCACPALLAMKQKLLQKACLGLVLLCLQLASRAQQLEEKISFGVQHVSLEAALYKLQQKTGVSITYLPADVKPYSDVTLEARERTLRETLLLLLQNTRLSYSVVKNIIVLTVKTDKHIPLPVAQPDSVLSIVEGKVVNEEGTPVAGVSIVVEGTGVGTVTSETGQFYLSRIPSSARLQLRSLGYLPATIIPERKELLVTLVRDQNTNLLDEVQVIGYGTSSKRYNTGNVAKITADVIEKQPVTNVLSALQGRAAGVFINSTNGLPGGNINVLIRGENSISTGKDPLYIVDNVPFNSTALNLPFAQLTNTALGSVSPLNSLNPADIESIEVLKDADATAIYGSRGANGVILITTKKGRANQTQVKLNVYSGTSKAARLPDLLSLQEYLLVRHEAYKNDGLVPSANPASSAYAPDLTVWDTTRGTDWVKYMLGGTSKITDVQASVSGGSAGTSFLVSANFRREGTIFPANLAYYKAGTHFNLQHNAANGKLGISFSGIVNYDKNNQVAFPVFSVLSLPPDFPLYDSTGKYNWTGVTVNPLALLKREASYATLSTVLNSVIKYTFFPGFTFKTSIGYTHTSLRQTNTFPLSSQNPGSASAVNYAQFGDNSSTSIIVEPQINYTQSFSKSNLTVLLGGTWQGNTVDGQFVEGSNYANEALLKSLSAAGTITGWYDTYAAYKYVSVFGRATFTWDKKYVLNATVRRDGSSRFGPGNRFGNFGSAGMAWLFSNESFIKKSLPFLSYGKLRASYGITGNDQISDYQYLSTYTASNPYQNIATLTPSRIANANYSWENNKKLEAGIELGLLSNRILATISYYRNRSGNQLVSYPLPYMSGPFGSYQANLPALIENKGWEFELSTMNIKGRSFSWTTNINFTLPRNTLLAFPGLAASSYANTYVIGQDLSVKRGYHFSGIDPQTGVRLYRTQKGGDTTAPTYNTDYFIMGRTSPYFYGGIANSFSYKGLQLDIFFQFSKQYTNGSVPNPGGPANTYSTAMGRWQKPGDITTVRKATTVPDFYVGGSDAVFINATYARLKNISLSYQVPHKVLQKYKVTGVRIFVEAQNLFTIMKNVALYDPETGINGIPPMKIITAGLQLTL